MRATPVVDRHAPPAEGDLGIGAAGEGQGFADLMGAHAPSGAVAPLDDGGVGLGVTQLGEHLMHTPPGAMGIADFGVVKPSAYPVLD